MSKTFDFSELQDTARQIENLAFLLRITAEIGHLHDAGEDVTEDAAAVIQEKARALGQMIEQAEAEANN